MLEILPTDHQQLEDIRSFGAVGGRPLQRGFFTRGEQRLIDAGLVEVRGDRLHLTHAGAEQLRSGGDDHV